MVVAYVRKGFADCRTSKNQVLVTQNTKSKVFCRFAAGGGGPTDFLGGLKIISTYGKQIIFEEQLHEQNMQGLTRSGAQPLRSRNRIPEKNCMKPSKE